MKLWLTALAVVFAAPLALAVPSFVPQGQGSSTQGLTTNSYEMVVYSSSAGEAQNASLGGSYGRIEEVGVTQPAEGSLSLDSASYVAGNAWLLDPATAANFPMLSLSPNAGFAFSEVAVPISGEITGPKTVRFDGVLAAEIATVADEYTKVSAPVHTPGPVDVTVDSPTKSITFESGFAYVPALSTSSEATQGQRVQIRLFGSPGTQFHVLYSDSLGTPTSIPGIDGTLDLEVANLTALGQVAIPVTLPGGAITHEGFLEFELPKSPTTLGKTYFVQAAAVDPNASVAFTNHTAVTIKN